MEKVGRKVEMRVVVEGERYGMGGWLDGGGGVG